MINTVAQWWWVATANYPGFTQFRKELKFCHKELEEFVSSDNGT